MKDDGSKADSERSDTEKDAKILAIGSGKGGVGKTVIAASLGLGLAMLKKRVVVVDVDLGGANLHKVVGIEKPDKTYYQFYNREYRRLSDLFIEHPHFENMRILIGTGDLLEIANLRYHQRMRFIRNLMEIDADFVILDLGAGSSYNVLDFFLTADQGIVVVNPDTLSILDGYNFVKKAFYRKITRTLKVHKEVLDLIQKSARTEAHRSPSVVKDLLKNVTKLDTSAGKKMERLLSEFRPTLLVNGIVGSEDETKSRAVMVAAKELLSIDMEYLGAIHKDENIPESVEAQTPFLSYSPESQASRDLIDIINKRLLRAGKVQSIRARWTISKEVRQKDETEEKSVICSVECPYWEACELKKGGYPCVLRGL